MSWQNRAPRLSFALISLISAIAGFYFAAGLAATLLPPSALYQLIFVLTIFPSSAALLLYLLKPTLQARHILRHLALCATTATAMFASIYQGWVTPNEGMILALILLAGLFLTLPLPKHSR